MWRCKGKQTVLKKKRILPSLSKVELGYSLKTFFILLIIVILSVTETLQVLGSPVHAIPGLLHRAVLQNMNNIFVCVCTHPECPKGHSRGNETNCLPSN